VKKLVGIKHLGIGTDFDGGGGVVGLENASKMKNITIELLKRGYTERELKLFWGENLIRLLKVHFK
jgi:microsomal dipeptidase-like Zn-dependent dipeptidase